MSVEHVWGFLEESGFIYPQKRQMINFDAAKATMSRLLCKNDVFKGLAVTRGGEIYGHLSAVRVYDKLWMVQHMASHPYKKEKVSHALMLNLAMLEYFETSPAVEWVRATYRHENKRVSRLYEALAAQVTDPSLSKVQYLNCMRISDLPPVALPKGYQVVLLPNHENLVPDEERFESLSEAYSRAGLERRREFLGVYHGRLLVGYAILEVSSPSLNLSDLTNAFRVSMLTDDSVALTLLIHSAVAHYNALGQEHVTALIEDGLVAAFEGVGFERFKRYTFWTWHRSLCRQFYDFIKGWG